MMMYVCTETYLRSCTSVRVNACVCNLSYLLCSFRCMCAYVCDNLCVCERFRACQKIVPAYALAYMYIHVFECARVCVRVHTLGASPSYVCVSIHVYTYTRMHMYIYIYIHMCSRLLAPSCSFALS